MINQLHQASVANFDIFILCLFLEKGKHMIDVSEEIDTTLGHGLLVNQTEGNGVVDFGQKYDL